MFRTFNFAGETGVPWQSSSVGQYKFTNWQAIDIGPGSGVLDVGDQVEVIISTAGCAWDKVIPFLPSAEVRRVIYTTNATESVNARLRKIIKTRGHSQRRGGAIWCCATSPRTGGERPTTGNQR